jgi:hypothetical protein
MLVNMTHLLRWQPSRLQFRAAQARRPPRQSLPSGDNLTTAAFSGPGSFLRRSGARPRGTSSGRSFRLSRQRFFGCAAAGFAFERALGGAGAFAGRFLARGFLTLGEITLRLLSRSGRCFAAFRRRQFHAGASRFGQTDGDGLLGRSRAVFALANVLHFFPDKLARLGGRREPFALVFTCSFDCFVFWHQKSFASAWFFGRGENSFWICSCPALSGRCEPDWRNTAIPRTRDRGYRL